MLFRNLSALSPHHIVDVKEYLSNMLVGSGTQNIQQYKSELYRQEIRHFDNNKKLLTFEEFTANEAFKNRKSSKKEQLYYNFYKANKAFAEKRTQMETKRFLALQEIVQVI